MSLLSWRSAKRITLPEPRGSLRSTPSRVIALPASGPRWHTAVVHLEDTLSAWTMPVHLARRWMQPAREVFDHDVALELFVQLDPVTSTVSVELWDDEGSRRFSFEAQPDEVLEAHAAPERRLTAS